MKKGIQGNYVPALLYNFTTHLLGSILIIAEAMRGMVPGTISNLLFNVLRTAISPTLSGDTDICIPSQPSFSFVSFLIDGFVKTGPGARQLTLICFFFNW